MNESDVSSRVVGPKLLGLFGINSDNVRRFTILCAANEPVIVHVEYNGELKHNTHEVEILIKEFELKEKDV